MRNRVGWAILFLQLFSCARTLPPVDLKNLPTPAQHPGADFVVLLDETKVTLGSGSDGVAQATEVETVRMLRLGNEAFDPVATTYDRTFWSIDSIEATLTHADGRAEVLDASKAYDFPALSSDVLFVDTRIRQLGIPTAEVGSVLEWRITKTTRDLRALVISHAFGGHSFVQKSRLVLESPPEWRLEWVVQFGRESIGDPPEIEKSAARTRHVWERTALKALSHDVAVPRTFLRVPVVYARPTAWFEKGVPQTAFVTAADLAKWLREQYDERATPDEAMKATVREVLKGVPDEPRAKAAALYAWVVREVQYCAVEIGYGGWIPHASVAVHKNRFGDCKDKATHLGALLSQAGIKSTPVLLDSHDGYSRPFTLPSVGTSFNHVILSVDLGEQKVLVDATEHNVPFGELPPRDLGSLMLPLAPEGAVATYSRAETEADGADTENYELTPDGAGNLQGTFSLESTGSPGASLRSSLLRSGRRRGETLERYLDLHRVKVDTHDADKVGDLESATVVKGNVTVRRVVPPQGPWLVRFNELTASVVPEWTRGKTARHDPWVSQRIGVLTARLAIKLPPQSEVAVPANVDLSTPWFDYRLHWRRTNEGVAVERVASFKQRSVEAADYEKLRAAFEEATLAESRNASIHLGGRVR